MKDDNVFLLNNTNDNCQDKLLQKVLDDRKKEDKNIVKVLLLITELQEKYNEIENMKNDIDEKWTMT